MRLKGNGRRENGIRRREKLGRMEEEESDEGGNEEIPGKIGTHRKKNFEETHLPCV